MQDSTPPSPPAVVGVVATYRRPAEVRRLLDSLVLSTIPLRALVLVDNANDAETRALTTQSALPIEYVAPGANLGCGGGLKVAEEHALKTFGGELTHIWVLDDDAVVTPDALKILLDAMREAKAGAAYPMIVDSEGNVGWYPGLLDPAVHRGVKGKQTPAEFIARFGEGPFAFSWAQGIALLVSRELVDAIGVHRDDFWVRGEDLEFSLRITHRSPGIFVPAATVEHLPPPPPPVTDAMGEYWKHRAMIQNVAYNALRLPHGRRIAWTIPSNWARFLVTWKGRGPRVLWDAGTAFWDGAVRGLPAGKTKRPS